jgi:hypothetical protein
MLRAANQWLFLIGLMIVFAWMTGRLEAKLVPDSASYIEYPFGSFDQALRSTRTIGYPLLIKIFSSVLGYRSLPLIHLILHGTAAWMLLLELGRWGMSLHGRWAATLAVALGCTTLDNLSIIATDLVAASFGVMAAACLLGCARWLTSPKTASKATPDDRTILWAIIGVACFGFLAITVRPAYLSLILWLPLVGTLLLTRQSDRFRMLPTKRAVTLALVPSIAILIPLGSWVIVRGVVVNDFSLLPFGHQNLAGITIQLASDEELQRVSPGNAELAKAIVAQKELYYQKIGRTPQTGVPSTSLMEQRWDDYVWWVVVPAADKLYPRDTIATHDAIASLNREIVGTYPMRYLRWLMLAARRAAWGTAANIVMHPIFLTGLVVIVVLELRRAHQGLASMRCSQPDAFNALFIVAVTYFAVNTAFVILTSPPLGRFIDASAIFIPAWIAAKMIERYLPPRYLPAWADRPTVIPLRS